MDCDVVVIGSGFGGSIAANRLTIPTKKVVLLERGPWRDSLGVKSLGIERVTPFPYGFNFFRHGVRTFHSQRGPKRGITLSKKGYFEIFRTPGLDILCTSSVGGGSHAYTAMLVPPVSPGYWQGHHSDLVPSKIEKYYDDVRADMGAEEMKEDTPLPNAIWSQFQGWGSKTCQPAKSQPHMALKLSEFARTEEPTDRGGVFGSPRGAKPSVDTVYLAPALARGLEVRDLCEVRLIRRVQEKGTSGFEIHYRNHRTGRRESVSAKAVVLAAGTMNTLRILFESQTQGGLHEMQALGKRFGGNGDSVGLWSRTDQPPSPFDAPPTVGRFMRSGEEKPFMALFGYPGIDKLPLPKRLIRKFGSLLPVVGMGADSGSGSVTFRNGRMSVHYDHRTEEIFQEINSVFRTLADESGMKITPIKKPITVHAWGGANLATDETKGVVDYTGESFENPGLYVADASALPAAAGGPPSLTISAWAHYVSDCVLEKHLSSDVRTASPKPALRR